MRRIALVTVLAFGCATARPPERGAAPAPSRRLALAEPQLELWMEGTRPVDRTESAEALGQSRDALARALQGRGLDAPEPDALVVVRAREVARTAERRTKQTWSVVGFVVGFVVVLAAVVILAKSRGSGGKAGVPGRSISGAAVPAPPRGVPVRPVPAPLPPRLAPPPPVSVFVGFDVSVPIGPVPYEMSPGQLPTDAWLERRGWFAGDEVELTVELQDVQTGAVLWRRIVHDGVDPRDAEAVGRLVDQALSGLDEGGNELVPPALEPLPEEPPEPLPEVPPPLLPGPTPPPASALS